MRDHKPLMHAFIGNHDSYSTWEIHHLVFISGYTRKLRHIQSPENQAADALSRVVALPSSPSVSAQALVV